MVSANICDHVGADISAPARIVGMSQIGGRRGRGGNGEIVQ